MRVDLCCAHPLPKSRLQNFESILDSFEQVTQDKKTRESLTDRKVGPNNTQFLIFYLENRGCRNGRFEKRCFVPYRKQVVLTEIGANSDIAFYPHEQGILLFRPRKSTKMTKMAGVTQAK